MAKKPPTTVAPKSAPRKTSVSLPVTVKQSRSPHLKIGVAELAARKAALAFDSSKGFSVSDIIARLHTKQKAPPLQKEPSADVDRWTRLSKEADPSSLNIVAEMLLVQAIRGEPAYAREALRYSAMYLREGKPPPRLMAIFLAQAFDDIAGGVSAETALHLTPARGAPKVDFREQFELFFSVLHLSKTSSPASAIRTVAKRMGITAPAAEKRYQAAKATIGPIWTGYRLLVRQRCPPVMGSLLDTLIGNSINSSTFEKGLDALEAEIEAMARKKRGGV